MSLIDEIRQQPGVIERLLTRGAGPVAEIAAAIRRRGVKSAFVAARGSSDNAALYGKYLWGSLNRLPVALATPSLFTLIRRPPKIGDCLVVGISQSGESPDIVSVVEEGRAQGALTLAITNSPSSPLARRSELVIDTATGPERAVAATKTYTAQLAAIALLGAALAQDESRRHELARLPGLIERALGLDQAIGRAVQRYRYMQQCAVVGRGFDYCTAYEWALKLKEMAYVVAEPYSSADFRHGPVALVAEGFPVLAVAVKGAVLEDARAFLGTLVGEHRAELVALSNDRALLDLAETPLRLPARLPEWLAPMVSIVAAQLFCYHLTRARGLDTEKPRRLSKITRTW